MQETENGERVREPAHGDPPGRATDAANARRLQLRDVHRADDDVDQINGSATRDRVF
jgi:hypothetical protein